VVTLVQTLRGGIDAAGLGATLMHEHVFMVDPEIIENVETEQINQMLVVNPRRVFGGADAPVSS
jgi:predicted metal-dependent phosphotriesterase family hydrolase